MLPAARRNRNSDQAADGRGGYIALGTGIGISMPAATYVRVSLIIVCVAALAFLARRTRRLIPRLRAGY